ncbi:DUF6578 domain-containing protein [Arthrobacter sp. TMT4-20]
MEDQAARGSSDVPATSSDGNAHFVGSYEPLESEEPYVAEDQDANPPIGPHEADVWLTEWQVLEDGFDVVLGDYVDWLLVPMDQDWLGLLFTGRWPVALQRDTYADAEQDGLGRSLRTKLTGHVTRIDQVSVRYQQHPSSTDRGEHLPEIGGAMQHNVSSIQERRGHHGSVVGWIVRVQAPAS